MEQKKIDRINELAGKKKTTGLTKLELEEQAVLRKEYIHLFRKNLIDTMESVSVQDDDGTIRNMSDITKKKHIE
ncbi:MAG: DUF896 domain-containing protein [Vallitaleaceae bacterium]|jgi:uncharacterized protein YnzC (UPF0291/DUF896 family)|nr:DUF896 domain-containing protein [Vallitaleaceae bacterium]